MLAIPNLAALAARSAVDRGVTRHVATRLAHSVALFSAWLGHQAILTDFNREAIAGWLADLNERYAAYSVWQYTGDLLLIWRDAAVSGFCEPPPPRIRRHKPRPLPIAWTQDEIADILRVCGQLTGTFPSGAPRPLYCTGLVRAAWSTGLRRSDLWRLDRNQVRPDGAVILRQNKTGAPHQPRFRPATYEIWTQLPGIRPLANPYRTEKAWYAFWRKHVIEPARVRPGCLQQLRRSGATHLAIEHPEAVQRYLGHASPEMQAWYVDWSIARPQQFLPPELA